MPRENIGLLYDHDNMTTGKNQTANRKNTDQNTIGPIYRRYLLAVFFPILRLRVDGELELIKFDRF